MALKATDDGIVIELECGKEDLDIEGNALAPGDDVADRRAENAVRAQLAAGNAWAWCTAIVRVTYRDAIGTETYLPACSYESEAAFRADDYFTEMVKECLLELDRRLAILCGGSKAGS